MRVSVWTAATLAWSLLVGGACPAAAQAIATASIASGEPAAQEKIGKELHALRIGPTNSIRIDGRIDDEPWTRAQTIADFIQEDPDNMAAPTEQTRARVAYDDRY